MLGARTSRPPERAQHAQKAATLFLLHLQGTQSRSPAIRATPHLAIFRSSVEVNIGGPVPRSRAALRR